MCNACTTLTNATEATSAAASNPPVICGGNAECRLFGAECHVVYAFDDIYILNNNSIPFIVFPELVNTTGFV